MGMLLHRHMVEKANKPSPKPETKVVEKVEKKEVDYGQRRKSSNNKNIGG